VVKSSRRSFSVTPAAGSSSSSSLGRHPIASAADQIDHRGLAGAIRALAATSPISAKAGTPCLNIAQLERPRGAGRFASTHR